MNAQRASGQCGTLQCAAKGASRTRLSTTPGSFFPLEASASLGVCQRSGDRRLERDSLKQNRQPEARPLRGGPAREVVKTTQRCRCSRSGQFAYLRQESGSGIRSLWCCAARGHYSTAGRCCSFASPLTGRQLLERSFVRSMLSVAVSIARTAHTKRGNTPPLLGWRMGPHGKARSSSKQRSHTCHARRTTADTTGPSKSFLPRARRRQRRQVAAQPAARRLFFLFCRPAFWPRRALLAWRLLASTRSGGHVMGEEEGLRNVGCAAAKPARRTGDLACKLRRPRHELWRRG